jgi:lipopolysaccharide transport system ATP-binding protein
VDGLITVRTPVEVELEYWNLAPNMCLNLSLVVYDMQGACVFNSTTEPTVLPPGLVRGVCHIPKDFLNDNIYRVRVLIVKDASVPLIDCENIAMFQVHDVARDARWYGKWVGIVRPRFEWTHELIQSL